MDEAKKIAIVGTAPSSRQLAPFDNKEWDIWGCSPGNVNQLPRCDAWFELHGDLDIRPQTWPYLDWLADQSFPVWMQKAGNPRVPKSIEFPKNKLVEEFGQYFFTSTVAWMLAYAISQKPKGIAIYGVDMCTTEEYTAQRPGCHYFLQKAVERGITIGIPPESDLHRPFPLYGYAEATMIGRKLLVQEQEYQGAMNEWTAKLNEAKAKLQHYAGAMEHLKYTQRTWI